MQHKTPSLDVPNCNLGQSATIKGFKLPLGNVKFPAETIVEIYWDEEFLQVSF